MIHDAVVHKITRRNPFLQDWPYYGIIDILNPVATAQYQHSVTIPTKPGMMHDFRDLRFFQADGIEIPFWVESKTDGSTAFVWFKPYSLSLKTVYVFYGNREAVSQSNGDKVFEFFDDFLGSSLDTSKWTDEGSGTRTISVSGSILTCTGGSGPGYVFLKSNVTFGTNYSVRARLDIDATGTDTTHQKALGFVGTTAGYEYFHSGIPTWAKVNLRSSETGVSDTTTDTGSAYSGYHTYEIRRNGTTSSIFDIDYGTYGQSHTTKLLSGDAKVTLIAYNSGVSTLCDWGLVRKYTATEPVCQLNQSGLRNPVYR